MKYFFVLGSNPVLSAAEIAAVLPANTTYELVADCLLVEAAGKDLDVAELMERLGGTIKIGQIVGEAKEADLAAVIARTIEPSPGKKFNFGFSVCGRLRRPLKNLAMELKRHWQEAGVNCRWVVSKEKNLSSVVVEQNGLVAGGAEIILAALSDKILIGRTLAVQPFKDWSRRDYGRPARDDLSGMLPPKLARIMLNLVQAQSGEVILDPFCGSGTILTEAAWLGLNNLIGSDVSQRALADTKNNLAWLEEHYQRPEWRCRFYQADAAKLTKLLGRQSVDKIVTEPYLGPSRGQLKIASLVKQLTALYNRVLKEFYQLLKPSGRLVMVWPVFIGGRQSTTLDLDLSGFKIIKPLPLSLSQTGLKASQRQTIVYGRPGQKIWREIVILQKK